MNMQTVFLLWQGVYEDRNVVGVYATRERAERAIIERVYEGKDMRGTEIEEEEVQA